MYEFKSIANKQANYVLYSTSHNRCALHEVERGKEALNESKKTIYIKQAELRVQTGIEVEQIC